MVRRTAITLTSHSDDTSRSGRRAPSEPHSAMSLEPCTPAFPSLPTELLILILSYLPVVELCAVQRTCRRIHNIVAESTHLQYILCTQINGVDDLLPPDCPFSERLELLRCHENAWSNLQLKLSHEFASPLLDRHFLQDGYLIYNKIAGTLQYGYVDLLAAAPEEDLSWVHISREEIRHPLCVVFAVDHNLAVVLRYRVLSDYPVPPSAIYLINCSGPSKLDPVRSSSLRSSTSRQARPIPFRPNLLCGSPRMLSSTWPTQRRKSWETMSLLQ